MSSQSKKVKNLLDNITQSRNIIFDEVQFLQEVGTVSVMLWERRESIEGFLKLDGFQKLCDSSPLLQRTLNRVNSVVLDVQPKIEELKKEATRNHNRKHLAIPFVNPEHVKVLEKYKKRHEAEEKEKERLQKLYPDKSWLELSCMLSDNSVVDQYMENLDKGKLEFSELVKIQGILINAIKNPETYNLTEDQIIGFSKLITVTNADDLAISYVKSSDDETISIHALDTLFYDSLRRFLQKLLIRKEDKRVIFTSATFGSISLEKLLGLKKIKDYLWGDPLGTSDKFLVVADKSRLSTYNFGKRLESIKALIDAIIKRYGPENIVLCAMNKTMARAIGHECTWYASDRTEGVPSAKRIWIFVGLAEKPSNSKDTAAIVQTPYHEIPADLPEEKRRYYLSQKLRTESVHTTTNQALSRAKDPHAKNRGVAIMIGARKEEVEQCLLWGIDRNLNETWADKGLKFSVDVKNPIGKPHLTEAPLSSDIEQSIHIIDSWLTDGKIDKTGLNWPHIKPLVDSRGSLSVKRLINVYNFDQKMLKNFSTSCLPIS